VVWSCVDACASGAAWHVLGLMELHARLLSDTLKRITMVHAMEQSNDA
jgi:hypothetical protein